MSRLALLTRALDAAYQRLRLRLDGLSDAEFFWQPVPGCWKIREDRPGHWTYDYAAPDPVPAPVTTIGWQVVHLATCKVMYHEYAYGAASLTWPDLTVPHTAADALALLDEGQRLLSGDLHALSEASLDEDCLTNWGERWPAWRVFFVMADHDALHGGVIGALRDLYHWTAGPGA